MSTSHSWPQCTRKKSCATCTIFSPIAFASIASTVAQRLSQNATHTPKIPQAGELGRLFCLEEEAAGGEEATERRSDEATEREEQTKRRRDEVGEILVRSSLFSVPRAWCPVPSGALIECPNGPIKGSYGPMEGSCAPIECSCGPMECSYRPMECSCRPIQCSCGPI